LAFVLIQYRMAQVVQRSVALLVRMVVGASGFESADRLGYALRKQASYIHVHHSVIDSVDLSICCLLGEGSTVGS